MKIPCLILTLLISQLSFAQNDYNYPISKETGKITYEKALQASGKKELLFKRVKQFLALQDYGRVVMMTTHSGKQLNSSIIKQPITYEDVEEGKIFGNGFLPFQYRGHDYFFIFFKYKIYVNDNEYRYAFTDFVVYEVMDPGFGSDRRTESKNFPLEEFVDRRVYDRSHPIFVQRIKDLKHQLRLAIDGNL